MTEPHDRDTLPPPPLAGVQIPGLKSIDDEPAPGATDRAWGLFYVKLLREFVGRPITLTLPRGLLFAVGIAIAVHIADDVIDSVFKMHRLAEPTHQVVCVPEPSHS